MKKRYWLNTLSIAMIYLLFLLIIFVGFDSTLGKLESDFLSQHTKFIDYLRLNFWASGDFFPSWQMNYGLGQSFSTLYYHGLYNPFLLFMYVIPRVNPIFILEAVYLFLIVLNGWAMTKLLDLNGVRGNLNSFVAILSSFSGYFVFHMTTHPMFIYYLPIFVLSLIALHYMASHRIRSMYAICVGLIFYTNFTFAPIISVLQFFYYIGLLVEAKDLTIKQLLRFITSYIIGVLIGMMVLIPQATLMVASSSRTKSLTTQSDLILPFEKVINSIATNPYMSGIFIFGVAGVIGALIFLRTKRTYIMLIPMLIILFIQPLNVAFNLFAYVHLKIYIWYMPILWLAFAMVANKVNKKQLLLLMSGSLLIIIIGHAQYHNLIIIILLIAALCVNYIVLIIHNKYISYGFVLILAMMAMTYNSRIVSRADLAEYQLNAQVEQNPVFTNSRTLNSDKNNLDSITDFTPNLYSSLENGFYMQAVRDEYESAKSSYSRDTKYYTFDNPYYQNLFSIDNDNFTSNPIVYGVTNQQTINSSEYEKLSSSQTIEAVSQYLFTADSENDTYISNFNIETVISDSREFTLTSDSSWDLAVPEQYNDGILTIQMEADIPEDSSVEQRIYINDQVNYTMYADRYGVNDNRIVTFILDTTQNPNLNIDVESKIGGDVTYKNLKVTYQSFDDFNESKLLPIEPTNFVVDLNDSFSFDITMEEDGYLATTIPYDSGFTFTIDGEESQLETVNDLYIGTKISKGTHSVVISYQIPGFKLGLTLTIIALALTVLLAINDLLIYKKNK